ARAAAKALDSAGDWAAALAHDVPELSLTTWKHAQTTAVEEHDRRRRELAATTEQVGQLRQQRSEALGTARERVVRSQAQLTATRQEIETQRGRERETRDRLATLNAAVADLRVQLAGADVERSQASMAELNSALDALPKVGAVESV